MAKSKTGRKHVPYPTSWGENIDGLYRGPNDRWRIVSTGERFTEHDERLAVLRFRNWQARQHGNHALLPIPLATGTDPDQVAEDADLMEWLLRKELGPGEHRTLEDDSLVLRIPANADPVEMMRAIPETLMYAWMKDELIRRPQYCAQQTGIEWLAYGPSIPKPIPSPTLDEVGNIWFDKSGASENWIAKSRLFWREFMDTVEVPTLREVTQGNVLDYADMVNEAAQTPTYSRQRFGAIKAIINFPTKRGLWAEDAKRTLAYCAVLVPPPKSGTDPHPISMEHFRTLLNVADDQMKAMLLLALNACMYGGEVAALGWSELDLEKGTLVTSRQKTGVIRIAVLWSGTVDALKKLPRTSEAIFITNGTKMQHNYQTVYKAFKALRKAAGLTTDVQFAHLRDGAYTTAVEAGIDLNACKLLAGHATGIADHYVKRRPQMVAAACEAIRLAYGL